MSNLKKIKHLTKSTLAAALLLSIVTPAAYAYISSERDAKEVRKLYKQYKRGVIELESLVVQEDDLSQRSDRLENKRTRLAERINYKKNTLEKNQRQIPRLEEENKVARQTIKRHKKGLVQARQNKQNIAKKIAHEKQILAPKRNLLQKEQKVLNALKAELNILRDRKKDIDHVVAKNAKEIQQNKTSIQYMQRYLPTLKQNVQRAEAKLNIENSKLAKAEADLKEKRRQLAEQRDVLAKMPETKSSKRKAQKKRVASLAKHAQSLQIDRNKQQRLSDNAQKVATNAKKQQNDMQQYVIANKAKIPSLNKEKQRLKQIVEINQTNRTNKNRQIFAQNKIVEVAASDYSKNAQQLAKLQSRKQEIKTNIENMSTNLVRQEQTIDYNRASIEEKQVQNSQIQQGLPNLRSDLQNVRVLARQAEQDLVEVRRLVRSIERDLSFPLTGSNRGEVLHVMVGGVELNYDTNTAIERALRDGKKVVLWVAASSRHLPRNVSELSGVDTTYQIYSSNQSGEGPLYGIYLNNIDTALSTRVDTMPLMVNRSGQISIVAKYVPVSSYEAGVVITSAVNPSDMNIFELAKMMDNIANASAEDFSVELDQQPLALVN